MLDRLKEKGLTLNGEKCEFRLPQLTFFGQEVTKRGINPSKEKVPAIQYATAPKNVSEARSFMGLVQYVSRFIPDLSAVAEPIQKLIAEPVQKLIRKGVKFEWGTDQQRAFEELPMQRLWLILMVIAKHELSLMR